MNAVVAQLLEWVWNRVVKNKISTLLGTGVGASVVGLLAMFGCDVNLMVAGLGGVIVASPMIFGTDANKVSESLLEAVKKGVEEAKK